MQLSCLSGIIVVFYDYFGAFKQPATVVELKSASTLPFLLGVVIYSYEGFWAWFCQLNPA